MKSTGLTLSHNFTLFGLTHELSAVVALLLVMVGIALVSYLAYYFSKRYILKIVEKISLRPSMGWIRTAYQHRVFHRAAYFIPGLVTYLMTPLLSISMLPYMDKLIRLLSTSAQVYMLIVGSLVISASLTGLEARYRNFKFAKQRPIKSYLQIIKMRVFIIVGIVVVSMVIGKSPTYFFTGLGAMTAVLMLVFKDSILGFVASIQLAAYDMVRLGDWIEMPAYGADGDVIDISLNNIKVQNFDKTIVTIPSYALLSSGVKNWRGMAESGGRRIKRAINIDVNTIKFCDDALLARLRKISVLRNYIDQRSQEIAAYNHEHNIETDFPVNGRRLTNLGLLRAYLEYYLSNHPDIHKEFTFLVRQLKDEGKGVPLEIYIFTNDTNWINYERIQSDIFDHVYAALPYFDLRTYQAVSGSLQTNQPAVVISQQPKELA